MKKIISAVLVFTGLTALFSGCSGIAPAEESSLPESSVVNRQERISSSPIDPEIIGKWSNGENGYIFGEDRKVSLFIDFSSMGSYFTGDDFSRGGELVGKENIEYDGKDVIVKYTEMDESDGSLGIYTLVNMTRKDEENPDSFDGVYTVNGCMLMEVFCDMTGMDYYEDVYGNEEFDFEAVVDGETFVVTFGNYCNYETLGSSLEMFSKYMDYTDETASAVKYNYTVDGDTLTMIYTDSEGSFKEVYTRVKE